MEKIKSISIRDYHGKVASKYLHPKLKRVPLFRFFGNTYQVVATSKGRIVGGCATRTPANIRWWAAQMKKCCKSCWNKAEQALSVLAFIEKQITPKRAPAPKKKPVAVAAKRKTARKKSR